MREPAVLLIHNRYQQAGGEDEVFAAERAILARHGHEVTTYTADNRGISDMSRLALARATLWNGAAYRDVRSRCRRRGRIVAHFHNPFPLISPAAYYAARAEGAVVVQTLHNYRLICPGGTLFRAGAPCEQCVGKIVPWPGVVHACYRADRQATAVTASLIAGHRVLQTWQRAVDVYIALTGFARRKFIEGGLPADRIVVKPNFLSSDPGTGKHRGGFALYAGRLAAEKGIATLLDAWDRLGGHVPLRIAGTGPLERMRTPAGVEWLGWQPGERVLAMMKEAAFLVLPSTWYEGFPVTLLQAFATGLPAIVSAHGSLSEIVDHGRTGCHVEPGNADDLARTVEWAHTHPQELARMGHEARAEFERHYTAEQHYDRLLHIYQRALTHPSAQHSSRNG